MNIRICVSPVLPNAIAHRDARGTKEEHKMEATSRRNRWPTRLERAPWVSVTEFDFRYNHREALGHNDLDRTNAAVRGAEGKRLTYHQPHKA
jgi:hypothetical protein